MTDALRMNPGLVGSDGVKISVGEVFTYPLHSHPYYELIFYRPFDGQIMVNATAMTPKSPLAILMTPSDLHQVTCAGAPSAFVKIAFTEDAVGGYLSNQLTSAISLEHSDPALEALRDRLTEPLSREEMIILFARPRK